MISSAHTRPIFPFPRGSTFVKHKEDIHNRWQEHFSELPNYDSRVETETIYNVPQSPVKTAIGGPHVLEEVRKAMKQVKNSTTSINDGIRSEVSKYG